MLAGARAGRQVDGELRARVSGLLTRRGRARLEPALRQQLPCSTAACARTSHTTRVVHPGGAVHGTHAAGLSHMAERSAYLGTNAGYS